MMKEPRDHELSAAYSGPVSRLLSIGESGMYDPATWPDYVVEFGLRREHAAELIRLACDAALNWEDSDSLEAWAPLHAWRALGQLEIEDAVAPLLAFLKTAGDYEAAGEELPAVFGMIGTAAIPPIAEFLSDRSNSLSGVTPAMGGLKEIAVRHPQRRGECVGILARMLERHTGADPAINGFVIWFLIDLAAVEAIAVIREAFRRGAVDLSIVGDEEDVEIALGQRSKRSTPASIYQIAPMGRLARPDAGTNVARAPRRSKIGRNDPCPCGSGKKYKKCCLQ